MKLAEWLEKNGVKQGEFGRTVELSQGRISQIAKRGTRDVEAAHKIAAATANEVTVEDVTMPRKPKTASEAIQ